MTIEMYSTRSVSYTHLLGVNEIVFAEEAQISKIPLEQLVVQKDYSKLPKNQQPLLNPQMQLTGLYFMQEVQRGIPNLSLIHI